MAVTERGTSTHGHVTTASPTITFPTGIQVGDLLVATWGTDFRKNSGLSGWLIPYDDYGSFFNGSVAYKVATSTEVSAGTVSLGLAGAGSGEWACVAIQAGTYDTASPVRVASRVHKTTTTSTLPQALPSFTTTASSRLYHFASRCAAGQTLTCSDGSSQWSTNHTANTYPSSSALYAEDITSAVSKTPTWSGTPTVANSTNGAAFVSFEVPAPYSGSGFATEIATSLEAWWRLDETSGSTAADSSGNSRNATYAGTPTFNQTTIRDGGVRATRSPSATLLASLAHASWMNLSTFTVTAWARVNTLVINHGYVGRYNSTIGGWILWTNTGLWSFLITNTTGDKVINGPTATAGEERFLALTYDGTTMSAYVDGTLVGTQAFALGTIAGTTGIGFDAYNATGSSGANDATLQDVTIHSAALTNSQIWSIFHAGGAQFVLPAPVATVTVSAPVPTITRSALLAPVATVTVSAPAPVLSALSIYLAPPAATVTVSAPPPELSIRVTLAVWTSDVSQQAVVEFHSPPAVLLTEPVLSTPPAAITERTIIRNSILLDPMTVDTDTGRVDPASFDTTITGDVGVYHVTVDGVDVTYWRGAPTVIGQMQFSEPGGEDSARLEFPQITSIDEAGTGDLAWLHTDAPVEIFITTPDDDRIHKFSGHLVSDNTGIGTALQSSWDVQGNIRQGDSIVHRVPTILDRTDIGLLVPKYLNEVPGRRYASIPPATTGITSKDRGSYSDTEWDYSQNLLGSAYELDGDQWTLTRSGINQYSIAHKDRSTVHWTITAGTPGIEFDLTEDVAALVNCIYGRGVGPDGYAWAGWCHPNLLPDDAPDYPMFPITDLIEVGVTDADTVGGAGVTTWQRRIQSLGYSVTVDGVYSTADALVCRQVQADYGLLIDGKVGPQTWAASFDTGSGGGDLNGSYRRPLAIISAVDPYLYAANGAIVGANPDYNPNVIRRERNIDYGTGITKAEATVLANMELARDSVTGWQGAITFKVDPREGSRHLMREGQNILLQGFRGGDVLLHISELSVDPSDDYMPVTVTVDSKARDAMSLSSVAQRDRDSKADPARRPGNPSRRSRQEQDMAVEYDGESGAGVIPHFPVYGGLWSVIRIPVSEVGNVKLTLATTSGPACPFSIGFFGLPLTPAHMNALVRNPLTNDSAWDTNAETLDEQYAFLESFGNSTQAAGYYPGGTTLTGRLKDTGSWEYISGKPPHIWVAIFAQSTCFIEGRVYPAPVV